MKRDSYPCKRNFRMIFLRQKQTDTYDKYKIPAGKPRPSYSLLDMYEHGIPNVLMSQRQCTLATGTYYV